MSETFDIAIIGGGAAGLATGIFAAQSTPRPQRIVVLDSAKKIGAKILVSGGGRCNVTHERVCPADFNGRPNIIRNVLREFDETRTVQWFNAMGVRLKREPTGKLFPTTDNAHTVLDALLEACSAGGIDILTGHRVTGVLAHPPDQTAPGFFTIHHTLGQLCAQRVVLATGGRSLPKTGSDGGGWSIARNLGHSVTDTYPALVPLILREGFVHSKLSGVSHEAELSTFVEGRLADRRAGSLLWTHFGVSGPVVMDASRFWTIAHGQGQTVEMRCSLLPGLGFEAVDRMLIAAADATPKKSIASVVHEVLPRSVAEAICSHCRLDPATPVGQVRRDSRRALVHGLTALSLPIERDRGWNYAEVTAGGVPLDEIDHRTMMSRIVPNLYLVGEILDCDGRIGGFNFQWAWSTGFVAAKALTAT